MPLAPERDAVRARSATSTHRTGAGRQMTDAPGAASHAQLAADEVVEQRRHGRRRTGAPRRRRGAAAAGATSRTSSTHERCPARDLGARGRAIDRCTRARGPGSTSPTLVTYQRSRKSSTPIPAAPSHPQSRLPASQANGSPVSISRQPGAWPMSIAALGAVAGEDRRRPVRRSAASRPAARGSSLSGGRAPRRGHRPVADVTQPLRRHGLEVDHAAGRRASTARRSSAIAMRRMRRTPSWSGPAAASASVSASRAT